MAYAKLRRAEGACWMARRGAGEPSQFARPYADRCGFAGQIAARGVTGVPWQGLQAGR